MKTIKQWLLEGLNDEDYKKAKQYEHERWADEEEDFNYALISAFNWAHSVEGWDYWNKINFNDGSLKHELGDTPEQVQQNFYSELKSLLKKYKAEMSIEEVGHGWAGESKVVVDFQYDESLFDENGTGVIPQLVLRKWEDGRD